MTLPPETVEELGFDGSLEEDEVNRLADHLIDSTETVNSLLPMIKMMVEAEMGEPIENADSCEQSCKNCHGDCGNCYCDKCEDERNKKEDEVKFTFFPDMLRTKFVEMGEEEKPKRMGFIKHD